MGTCMMCIRIVSTIVMYTGVLKRRTPLLCD